MEKTTRSVVWLQFVVLSNVGVGVAAAVVAAGKDLPVPVGFKFSIPDRQKPDDASMPYHSFLRPQGLNLAL